MILLPAILFLVGCGGEYVPPLAPVKGTVTVAGDPLTTGQVSLVPLVTPAKPIPPSMGKIGADGTYEIFTAGKPGAPIAKYKVFVTPPTTPTEPGAQSPAYDKKYRDPSKTTLEIEVVAKADAGHYDLKLTK
jgi:hypothetical protein